jgi:subfamily B ATP-binding cassette protein MsbA
MVRLGRRLRRAATASQEHMALVANRLTESVSGVKVIQSFGMEEYEKQRFGEALQRMLRADLKAGRAQSLGPAVMELLGAMAAGALFYVAGLYIARGSLDPGNFAVVLSSLGLLFMSLRRMNTFYAELQIAQATAVRIFDVLDRQREIRDAPGARLLSPFREQIDFDQVEFSYGDETVLRRIDLTIGKGETVALVGPSGSGKSTLANLLPRFYDPTVGRIRVDGVDIRQASVASLRGQIGLVTQETVLFDDTVRNNIAYGRADIPLERVVEVARQSQAHEFIQELPQGYDTMLGERGARLSMGQRQRITIARALLKDPPILILDEATSALDAQSEALVQEALEVLMRGRTSVVIAHRLATVRQADRILVIEQGRIVEQGTHDQLLARAGAYARLHELQFKETRT